MLTLIFLSLTGCFEENKDAETASLGCEETAAVISLKDATSLGISGQDMLNVSEGLTETELLWADDGTTPLTIEVTYSGGEVRFIDSEVEEPEGDGPYNTAMPICDDRVEVDVEVAFHTEDGAFAELWALALRSTNGEVYFSQPLEQDTLQGSLNLEFYAPDSDYDAISVSVEGAFDGEGDPRGSIDGQATGSDGEVAWAELFEIGSWPAAGEE